MNDNQALKVIKACIIIEYPATGFQSDPDWPNVTQALLWLRWYQYHLKFLIDPTDPEALPPGYRVFCSVAVPDWCNDKEAFENAIAGSNVEWSVDAEDSAEEAVDAMIASLWTEP